MIGGGSCGGERLTDCYQLTMLNKRISKFKMRSKEPDLGRKWAK